MPRGRRARTDTPVRWEVSIPTSLAAEIELYILDPVRRTQAFGARSALIQRLLREWLEKQRAVAVDKSPVIPDNINPPATQEPSNG